MSYQSQRFSLSLNFNLLRHQFNFKIPKSNMIIHLLVFSVILIITSPSSTSAQSNCTRVCRGGAHGKPVSYPFGFSDGCEIRLDCSVTGEPLIGEYIVENITRDHILVNLPAKCDRRYEEIQIFNNTNFLLSSRNGLLLENCSSTLNNCVVSTTRVQNHFNLKQCNSTMNATMNCYSEKSPDLEEFINLKTLEASRCQILFSSVTVDVNGSSSPSMPASLEFQFLELGWWVRGECSCDQNAICRDVLLEKQRLGYRCHCNDGYAGDGFSAGDGCRRDADEGRKSLWALVIIASALSVGGVTIGLIVIIICLKGKFRWRKKANNNVKMETFLKNQEFLAPKRYSYSQIKKMTNSFKIKLGQGGFGTVYKGVLSNQNIVAVKVLSELKGNGEDFMNEVASVGRTSHVNIVCLVGFCLEGHRRALIYEFMPNGSLERFIYGQSSCSSSSQLGWQKLHQIAIGIARGLEYLHKGCNTRILHLDIKPHNILLDQNLCPKISDFGLSKLFPDKRSMISMSHMRGTPGYIAPELFSRNFGQVSHKSDVYSYGMMILEMVGGRKNIEVEVDHTSEIYFPHWIYKKLELAEEQLGLHDIVSDEENAMARKMIIVGLWCIQTNPLNRPTITKVLDMLEGDLLSLEIPPKPYICSPSRSVGSHPTD